MVFSKSWMNWLNLDQPEQKTNTDSWATNFIHTCCDTSTINTTMIRTCREMKCCNISSSENKFCSASSIWVLVVAINDTTRTPFSTLAKSDSVSPFSRYDWCAAISKKGPKSQKYSGLPVQWYDLCKNEFLLMLHDRAHLFHVTIRNNLSVVITTSCRTGTLIQR